MNMNELRNNSDVLNPLTDNARYMIRGEDDRRTSIMEMERTMRYFMLRQPLYDEYDYINNIKIPHTYDVANTVRTILICLVIAGILVMLPTACIAGWFILVGMKLGSAAFWEMILFSAVIIACPILLIGVPVAVCIIISKSEKNKRRDAILRSTEIAEELEKYFMEFGYCVVGMEYSNPRILKRIYDMIRQGRADTPKEALNALIRDRHHKIMEIRASQIAMASRITAINTGRIAANTERIAANTGRIAANTGVTAWFCAASFLLG